MTVGGFSRAVKNRRWRGACHSLGVLRRFKLGGRTEVVLGAGASECLGQELERLGARRALVLATRGRRADAERVSAALGALSAGVLDTAEEHVPIEVAIRARAEAAERRADALVAFGGGSTTGLAKAVALERPLPIVAVPTTYSGSEMTPIWGITEGGVKRTGRDERVRAASVLYDPLLTLELPAAVGVPSAFNALAHSVEALYASDADAEALLFGELGARELAESLPLLAGESSDPKARERALYGACLAGACLARASMGLHHKLCHVLGGSFGLPHARTHAALLPHVARFNLEAAEQARERLGRSLRAADPAAALFALADRTGVRVDLSSLGLPHAALERVVELVIQSPYANPRAVSPALLRELLEDAYHGRRAPSTSWTTMSATLSTTPLAYQSGFASTLSSEALPGALPTAQNSPRRCPYDLYAELLSGTPFTVRRAQNRRVWFYRIRPSLSHSEFLPLGPTPFSFELGAATPNKLRWRPLPLPSAEERIDWLDGLVTLGGWGQPSEVGYAVHLYRANAPMRERCFSNADGDLLILPQHGALSCRTEFGSLEVAPGEVLLLGRGMKLSVAPAEAAARGYVLEVFGRHLELPERGLIGSNGLADERHFLAPVAAFEDRESAGYQQVLKLDGVLHAATQSHSPFDVVAWHGNYAPYKYDLAKFTVMGSVSFDHPDPSILTVLTCPLDDHGRSVADFVIFPGRWDVAEHSFRPPFLHRNSATELNGVIKSLASTDGFDPGCTFLTPLLTAHGVSTRSHEAALEQPDSPRRISDESLWFMFESCLPFRPTRWALETPLLDPTFAELFSGMRKRFDPSRP
jgi:homogentisate 1,2-dioxygenase